MNGQLATNGHLPVKSILLIDSYDSFTFNLSKLVELVTGAHVVTIRNDSIPFDELVNDVLPLFDAVVVGPGPGNPTNPDDVGVLPHLWQLENDQILPIFGVCLGFQSMILGFGGQIRRLQNIKHGQIGQIVHTGTYLFESIAQSNFPSTRYHSLHGTNPSSDILPLAYCSDEEHILMAGMHTKKPFYGVQYHPESICSEFGEQVIANFWKLAQQWSVENGRQTRKDTTLFELEEAHYGIKPLALFPKLPESDDAQVDILFRTLNDFSLEAADICDNLKENFILLNSAADPGRWSIIGVLEPGKTNVITYYTGNPQHSYLSKWGENNCQPVKLGDSGIWEMLASYMAPKIAKFKNIQLSPPEANFVGGLVGYISYEAGIDRHVKKAPQFSGDTSDYADVSLVDIERCILVDNSTRILYTVSLINDDWVDMMLDKITQMTPRQVQNLGVHPKVEMPNQQSYIEKIKQAKEFLKSGDSYELCLTAQTKLTFPEIIDPWTLYKILLNKNPSPYSCFMDLPNSILVGSSPERFMSWRRDGTCQFRPIKGTVKKGPNMTREKAEAILNTPKERGENLMIVDLIRHDLNQLLSNVRVDRLMTVEEYKTVYQLVSVISGDLPDAYFGIDLLAHSLPPGSMTGAPKIRSVEILNGLEDRHRRGIYSGVAGYWSVLDEGDWSVIIRSAFSYKSDPLNWRIGAGGAITILSDEREEWDEMKTKLESALQAFN
jgi:para-aminobenzoate synthetase